MKTEHLLAETLKKMMATSSLDSITAVELSKKCNVSVKTFYYHFHDIYDLLTLVFLDERINKIQYASNISTVYECIYDYYLDNKGFIDATLDSAGKDLFQEFIYNNIYQFLMRDANRMEVEIKLIDKKNIVRFYASGISNSIVTYLSNTRNKSLQGLKNTTNFLRNDFLKDAIKQMLLKEGE